MGDLAQVSDRLSLSITDANGRVTRWGDDEPNASDIPGDLQFDTRIPGGYGALSCSLLRDIRLDWADLNLFDNVRVYGPGNRTAWEGRLISTPRSHGSSSVIAPSAVGHAAHLKDNPSFMEVYVDRELGRWQTMSAQRRINRIGSGFALYDGSITQDPATGSPALTTPITDQTWGTGNEPHGEMQYRSPVPLGSLYYAWTRGSNIDPAFVSFHWAAGLATDDTIAAFDISAELRGVGPGTGTVTAVGTRKAAWVEFNAAQGSTYGTPSTKEIMWTCLAVYGAHGLTKRGTNSATEAQGFYASDVVADIVGRAAPQLTFTTGPGGSIEQTDWVISHLVFPEPVTAEDAIMDANKYDLLEWGVYDNREFFYRSIDPDRLCWEARLSDGVELQLEGDVADNVYNGVVVQYTDPAGVSRVVGPPGTRADATDPLLADTNPNNPVNAHGLTRYAILRLSFPAVQNDAVRLGQLWMAELSLPQRRGTITLTGRAKHPSEGWVPAWRPRAGDFIRIADHPADVPRRILTTRYTHGNRQMQLEVGNDIQKVEAIFERIGVSLIGVV